jgi:DNA-binding winged helix-turn-helix (wHTH) protein
MPCQNNVYPSKAQQFLEAVLKNPEISRGCPKFEAIGNLIVPCSTGCRDATEPAGGRLVRSLYCASPSGDKNLEYSEKGSDVPTPGRCLVYESGEWELDLARRELRARGVPVPIGGRAFEIIEVLVQSAGELVTKNDLAARVWPGATVEDNTLQVQISAIRRALGPDREMLKTVSGRGYRLLGAWTSRKESVSAAN